MNIAVLFSGHLRAFEKCSKSIKQNLLSNQEADYYVHTWDELEVDLPKEKLNPNIFINNLTSTKLNQLQDIYNIKELKIDTHHLLLNEINKYASGGQISASERQGFHGNSLTHYLCTLYSWKKSFELFEKSDKKYDIIIKTRPDLVFPDKVNFINPNDLMDSRYKGIICTPNIATYYGMQGFNDQFCYGDLNGIKYYCTMYDRVISYISDKVCNPLRPETLLKHSMNIGYLRIMTVPLRYYILRTSGTVLYPRHNDCNMHSGPYDMVKGLI